MKYRLNIAAGLVSMITFAASATALGATYSFTNIVDSTVAAPTGNYFNIGDAAISGNKVAFKACYGQGGFSGIIDGIFTSTGGPRTKVVQELTDTPVRGIFSSLGRPSIDGNSVVFLGHYFVDFGDEGDVIFRGEGVYRADSPVVSAAITGAHPAADPLISQGVVARRRSPLGLLSDPDYSIRATGTVTQTIVTNGDAAPPGGTFSSIDANYGLSGNTVVFRGTYGSQEGIFTGAGGPLTTIAKQGDPTPFGGTFSSLLDPAISGDTTAFLGTYAGGSGIFTGSGGPLTAIVKSGDTAPSGNAFTDFSSPAIGGNSVAFRGNYVGGSGLYTKTGDELSKVVEIGDSLFGSTVATFTFTDLGFDAGGSGNLAFTYDLADGRNGVAMAYAGPAPAAIYQWKYVNPADPNAGKRQSTMPVLEGNDVVAVPTLQIAGRDLTSAYFIGADMRNAIVRFATLTDADLTSADLSNADLRGADLRGAVFRSAKLTGANLSGADVRHTSFERTSITLQNCGIFCFPTTTFYGGITLGQLASTKSYNTGDLSGINLAGNNLTNANFAGRKLIHADLHGATLTGANFNMADISGVSFGRYSVVSSCSKGQWGACTTQTNTFGSGISFAQLATTKNFQARNLEGVDLSGNQLAGGNFSDQNLTGASFYGANLTNATIRDANITNVNFHGSNLTGAILTGADARGSLFTEAVLTEAHTTSFIQSDGRVSGLNIGEGQTLSVYDYEGGFTYPEGLPIQVEDYFTMTAGGTLRLEFDADDWGSTISFAPGIPVAIGGMLELTFAADVNLASQIGRTFKLFDWTSVAPTGVFDIVSPYTWNLSNLYTTGEVTLTGVPEPATLALLMFAAAGCCVWRRRSK